MDTLQFKRPALLNDIVVIVARVTHVGRTSVEVQVDSFVEDVERGERNLINSAFLTEVHVDEEGRPQPVPFGLALSTQAERDAWDAAEKRIGIRRTRKELGF